MIVRCLTAGSLAGSLALALIPPAPAPTAAPPPRPFFGVDPQSALDPVDYGRMREAGIGTLRFQLSWAAIEPGPDGEYDWSSVDPVVAGAAANGVRALPFALGAPEWALALDRGGLRAGDRPSAPQGPRALAAWRAFLAAAVDRYGPSGTFWSSHPTLPRLPIRDWQIWNEMNSPTYWRPKPDVKGYARLLEAAHEAITDRDSGATVILGGMFGTPFGGQKPGIAAWEFLARLYRRPGARQDFEAVAAHPYAARFADVRAQIERLRGRMVKAGDERSELWVTELGWASGGEPHPLNRGPAGQARRLAQSFRYLIRQRHRLELKNVTWYSWRDSSATGAGLCEWCPQSGLLNEDRSAKPAMDEFMELTGAR